VAALPNGRYAVLWAGAIQVTRPKRWVDRLIVQLVDSQGSPHGAPLAVHPDSMNEWWTPAMTATSDGTLILAWTGAGRIHAVSITTAPELRQLSSQLDLGNGFGPRVSALPGGAFVAAWLRYSSTRDQVVLRTFDADGAPRGDERAVSSSLPGSSPHQEAAVRVSTDAAGRGLLVWKEATAERLRALRFSAGELRGEPIDLAARTGDRKLTLGEIATLADGTHLVSWTSAPALTDGCWGFCSPIPEGYVAELHAAIVGSDGSTSGQLIATSAREVVEEAAGVAANSEGWIVVGRRWRYDDVWPGDGIGARRIRRFGPCFGPDSACLARRFRVTAEVTHDQASGGRPLAVSDDTAAFWFFSPGNVELVAKVVDGTAVNGHHWVFFASLTDVAFELVVTDTVTGAERRYANPRGTMASRADVTAFAEDAASAASGQGLASTGGVPTARAWRAGSGTGDEEVVRKAGPTGAAPRAAAAAETASASLSGGRFTATVDWRLRDGTGGAGTAVPLSDDTALFWFFAPQNLEMAVKVLDGTAVNGRHWVFFASLTDVEFDLTVVDQLTGDRRTYHNPAGTMASRADVIAFPP
jgi:hypothetical protein